MSLVWFLEWVTLGLRWLLCCVMSLVWFSAWLHHTCVTMMICLQNVLWFGAWMSHTWVTMVTRLLNVLGVIQCLSESHVGRDSYSVAHCSRCDSVLEWVTRGSRWLLGCSVFPVWFNAWVSHTWVALVTRLFSVLGVIQCLSELHAGRDDYSVAQCSWCDSVLKWVTRGSRWLLGCSVFSVWFNAWVSHTCVALVTRLFSVLGVIQCLSESHVGRDDYSVAQCSWFDSVLKWVTRGSRWLLGCSVFSVWFNAWVSHTWVALVTRLLNVLGVIQRLSESHVGCHS